MARTKQTQRLKRPTNSKIGKRFDKDDEQFKVISVEGRKITIMRIDEHPTTSSIVVITKRKDGLWREYKNLKSPTYLEV